MVTNYVLYVHTQKKIKVKIVHAKRSRQLVQYCSRRKNGILGILA